MDSQPWYEVFIDLYTSPLPIIIATFIKRMGRNTLPMTLNEAIKLEKELIILKSNLGVKGLEYYSSLKDKKISFKAQIWI